jgi:hypothetical protein
MPRGDAIGVREHRLHASAAGAQEGQETAKHISIIFKNLNEKKNSRKKIIQPFSQSPRDWVIPGAHAIEAF